MTKSIDWVLFDLDNTLLDFDKSSEEAFHWLISEYSTIDAHPELYPRYSQINHQLWEQREQGLITPEELKKARWALFFEEIGLKGLDPEQANRLYFEHIADAVHFVDGALDILNSLQAQYQLMIVTNGLAEVQHPRLEKAGLKKYFRHIVISDEIDTAKPQIAFFSYCQKLMGNPDKDRILVIGDTLKSDIRGGNEFGYRTCWFNHDRIERDEDIIPDYEIYSLSELRTLIPV